MIQLIWRCQLLVTTQLCQHHRAVLARNFKRTTRHLQVVLCLIELRLGTETPMLDSGLAIVYSGEKPNTFLGSVDFDLSLLIVRSQGFDLLTHVHKLSLSAGQRNLGRLWVDPEQEFTRLYALIVFGTNLYDASIDIRAYRDQLGLDVGRAAINSLKAAGLLRAGEYEAAIAACTQAIESNPGHVPAYRNRAEAYERLGNGHEGCSHDRGVRQAKARLTSATVHHA